MKIICTPDIAVPEIWSSKDRIILNYFVNFKKEKNTWRCHHFTQVYEKLWSSTILFQRCGARWMSLLFFILENFSPFDPWQPKKWKCHKNLKKKKNHLEISSFNTSVPKIMIICYIAPEIWHIADIIVIFHFGLFLLFYSLSSPKNENLKTMKRNPEDNIILQKCTKNHDHMLYCSWDICCVTDVNVIFILGYFLPFYHSNSPKNQSFKKTNKKTKKKHLEISFYTFVPKTMIND